MHTMRLLQGFQHTDLMCLQFYDQHKGSQTNEILVPLPLAHVQELPRINSSTIKQLDEN